MMPTVIINAGWVGSVIIPVGIRIAVVTVPAVTIMSRKPVSVGTFRLVVLGTVVMAIVPVAMLGAIAVIATTIVILATGLIVAMAIAMVVTGFIVAKTGAIRTIPRITTPGF